MKSNMNLTELSNHFHKISRETGWWMDIDIEYYKTGRDARPSEMHLLIAAKFALIHSEVSEAFEGYRRASADDHLPYRLSVEVELADVLIRVFDLAGALHLDLDNAVLEKSYYNRRRADHKPDNRAKEHGKKF